MGLHTQVGQAGPDSPYYPHGHPTGTPGWAPSGHGCPWARGCPGLGAGGLSVLVYEPCMGWGRGQLRLSGRKEIKEK